MVQKGSVGSRRVQKSGKGPSRVQQGPEGSKVNKYFRKSYYFNRADLPGKYAMLALSILSFDNSLLYIF